MGQPGPAYFTIFNSKDIDRVTEQQLDGTLFELGSHKSGKSVTPIPF